MEESVQSNENIKKCVTGVVYDHMHKPYFLVLKRQKGWEGWEFLKGGIKDGETPIDALKREIQEETGLQKYKVVKELQNVKKEYTDSSNLRHIHSIFLIEASMNIPINIQQGDDAEHSTYLWCEAESALSKLTHDNDKEILKYVIDELK